MTILVTGARGNVGRCVLDQLLAAGHPVRALHRGAVPTDLPDGVEFVAGDLADPASLAPAFDGVDRVFLYSVPGGVDGFVRQAGAAGVGRVVALSSASVVLPNSEDSPIARRHLDVERALARSAMTATFLRPGAFAANTLAWAQSIRAEGIVRVPYPDSFVVPIDEADIAAVAVAVLTGGGHHEGAYLLTGPAAITQRAQVATIADVLGRPLTVVEQSPAEARADLVRHLPPQAADMVLGHLATNTGPREITDVVERVTGRPARTFAQWATEHAGQFR